MSPFRRSLINLNLVAFSSGPPKPSPNSFDLKVLASSGIGRVAFLRHGNTAPAAGVDFNRQLTDLGRNQAREAGSSYGVDLKPFYPLVLCSPAPRCVETANIFLAAACSDQEHPDFLFDQNLYDGTMQPEGSKLFKKIGYAPLRSYYEDPDEADRNTAHEILGAYSETALNAIQIVAATNGDIGEHNCTLILFAHAVYLPAAAFGFASVCGCSNNDLDGILDCNTKEGEGFLVDTSGKSSLLFRPGKS